MNRDFRRERDFWLSWRPRQSRWRAAFPYPLYRVLLPLPGISFRSS